MSTAESQPDRRQLAFDELDDVIREVDALHAVGYRSAGQWNLAQVCGHLADWIRYPLDGFPRPPAPLRPIIWGLRHTVGPRKLRQSIESRSMPAGLPTIPESVPPAETDEAAAIATLGETIARFKSHDGPLHPSPVFGPLDREKASAMHLVHAAHHLSFLVPRNESR